MRAGEERRGSRADDVSSSAPVSLLKSVASCGVYVYVDRGRIYPLQTRVQFGKCSVMQQMLRAYKIN